MNKLFVRTASLGALLAVLAAAPAQAGLILLSGDSNIGNPIDGTSGAGVNLNNRTWFTNILEGGTTVKIQNDSPFSPAESAAAINAHYNSLAGVTSTLGNGGTAITDALLSGVDLFITMLTADAYTAAEIGALSSYLAGGGSVFFIGENNLFPEQNAWINEALVALGSGMALGSEIIDAGFHTTTNIDADPLNVGVSSFTYAATTSVINGGTSLMRTQTTSPFPGAPNNVTFIAYERTAVPEPATLTLLVAGVIGLGLRRRRQSL